MIYILGILAGIITGLAMGGSFRNCSCLKIKKQYLFLAAAVVQIIGRMLAIKGFAFAINYGVVITSVSFAFLLAGFWFNRHYSGTYFMGTGLMCNWLVMAVNGGRMPVSRKLIELTGSKMIMLIEQGKDIKHVIMNSNTKLPFLSDVIYLPKFLAYGVSAEIVSVGDLIIVIGVLVLTINITTKVE